MISLLTDFGTDSTYVAAMKAVILGIAPEVRLLDIGHNVPAQNILQGAFRLAGLVPLFPPGTIHLAVIDPEVGTDRKILLLEFGEKFRTKSNRPKKPESRNNRQYLVCPDNGLASLLLEKMMLYRGGYVENRRYWREPLSNTFHGRDIMAPVAAHLANGVPSEEFGPQISDSPEGNGIVDKLVRLEIPRPHVGKGEIVGSILFGDHFGNLITNIPAVLFRAFAAKNEFFWLTIDKNGEITERQLRFVATYGNAVPGELVLLESSDGYMEIAKVKANAAAEFAISDQASFSIRAWRSD